MASNFDIWFAVIFNGSGQALWIRYSRLLDRYFFWASFFDTQHKKRHCYGAVERNWDQQTMDGLKGCSGSVITQKGELAWELNWEHRFASFPHGPGLLANVPCLRSKGIVASPFGWASGWVSLNGERFDFSDSTMTLQHLWGRRRIHELFWAFIPFFDSDASGTGIELVSVKMSAKSPRLVFGTFLQDKTLLHGQSIIRALGSKSEAHFPRWQGSLKIGKYQISIDAILNEEQVTPYVYRDLSGSPRYIAHSDASQAEVQISSPALRRVLHSKCAAVEFHGPCPWSTSHSYLDPYGH